MKTINDGEKHKLVFSNGRLYIDDIQVAGEEMEPETFEIEFIASRELVEEAPPLLEINVHDSVTGKSVGPGQG